MFDFPVPDIQFQWILPILIVAGTGLLALIVEMLQPKRDNSMLVGVSLLGLIGAGAMIVGQINDTSDASSGMIVHDGLASVLQLVLVASTALTILFSDRYMRAKRVPFGEFYPLVLWSTCGAMLMASSENLMMIFLGLEILSIALYVMACMSREEEKSEESAMKYFLLGAFASGFLLYGIANIYGATGGLQLTDISAAWIHNQGAARLLLSSGVGLMLVGLCFKAGLVPFHQWTPDVYQGAPTNVTAFMATASKIGAFAAMWRLLDGAINLAPLWIPAMSVIAIITMLFGNVMALAQTDVKRVLAYSSISHAGYVLVAIIAHGANPLHVGIRTICFYLLSYSLMTIGAFAIVSLFAATGKEATGYDALRGLGRKSPLAAALLGVFMLSLIGLPPFAGFFGKAFIFYDAIKSGLLPLAIVLAVSSVISVAYYLRIALAAVAPEPETRDAVTAPFFGGTATAGVLCGLGVLAVSLFYTPLMTVLSLDSESGVTVVQKK